MRCRYCETPVSPKETSCPGCGGGLSSTAGASFYERISRQVEADHSQWREDWRATESLSPPESFLHGASLKGNPAGAVSGGVSSAASAPRIFSQFLPQGGGAALGPVLQVEALGMLNLLLLHGGFSPFRRLQVTMSGEAMGGEAMGLEATAATIEITARPAAVLQRTVPIDPGSQTLDRPSLAPDLTFFESHDEAVQGILQVRLVLDGLQAAEQVVPVTIQPAGEWVDKPGAEVALAGAVTPNGTALAELVASLNGDFMAYQGAAGEKRRAEVAEVYRGVGALGLKYIGNPPSFEGTGQKVLFPDQVLKQRQACCLDIALLEAALLERLGYRPLIFFLRDRERGAGHALCGVWAADVQAQTPVLRDFSSLEPLLAQGDLLVWNSTAYFEGAADDFKAAEEAGRTWLKHFSYALDIAACRAQGVKPVPRRRS